jgi:serine/threonine protein kinase/tetratricopeptide (TPR) repeat protein
LAEYHEAADSGHPPDREAFLHKYSDVRDELEGYLDSFDLIRALAPKLHDTNGIPSVDTNELPPRATLGDFRIVREIGRGGMGVVYEAEQLSLGRRVALKVLPFAAMLESRRLARFRHEAQAAAMLRHPHIVTVYSVGCERGVHYYAMDYVEGPSLAEVVEKLRIADRGLRIEERPVITDSQSAIRNPQSEIETVAALSTLRTTQPAEYFRSIARLGIQTADALDYAHQMGVVHRDIKPSNLLLDSTGKLWITDFGLAMTQTDAGLTMTGDLLGTLRYMSPEQAAGKRLPLDHRTDVYSLGMTLYELLVGRAAFDTSDRAELLRAIAEVEPTPLRKLVPMTPVDLATIIHKAMEKDAADRYGSANELAHDLQQFLEHRPIVARPPSLVERAAKWSRRHVALVWAGVFMLLAATIGSGLSTWLISAAHNKAITAGQKAETESHRAVENLNLSLEALDRMYGEVIGRELADLPRSTRLREQLLREALGFYERFAKLNRLNENNWPETGRAYLTAGRIHSELTQFDEAVDAFLNASEIFDTLRMRNPHELQYIHWAAQAETEYAGLCVELGLFNDAISSLRRAFRLLEPGGDPATDDSLAAQLELADHAILLATIYHGFGEAYALAGQNAMAEKSFRRALRLRRGLTNQQEKQRVHQLALGQTLGRLALVAHAAKRQDKAIKLASEAIAHEERALQLAPSGADTRRALRDHYHLLGNLQLAEGDLNPSIEALTAGNDLGAELAADYPDIIEDQFSAGFSHFSLSSALLKAGRRDEAEASYRRCLSCWQAASAAEMLLAPPNLIHDTISCHFDAIQLNGKQTATEAYRDAIKQLTKAELFGAWTALVDQMSDKEFDRFAELDDIPQLAPHLRRTDPLLAEYAQAFSQIIDALSRDDAPAAQETLQRAAALENDTSGSLFELVEKTPVVALYTKSYQFLLGHARALEQLGRNLAESNTAYANSPEPQSQSEEAETSTKD